MFKNNKKNFQFQLLMPALHTKHTLLPQVIIHQTSKAMMGKPWLSEPHSSRRCDLASQSVKPAPSVLLETLPPTAQDNMGVSIDSF